MKLSIIIALSVAALASAQVPKGTGPPKGSGGMPKGSGGMPKGGQSPRGMCAAQCLFQPMQSSGCNIGGAFPKGGAGGAPKLPPKGSGAPVLFARQVSGAPRPTGAPKFSISPEQSSAIASARSCFCSAPALKSAAESCVPSACATATGAGEGFAKMVNGMCKGVAGFTALTAPPAAPAAAAATPAT